MHSITSNILENPYLKEQIFTYIGNKRKLLPLVLEAIKSTGIEPEKSTFIDLFTGSGIISRLAKVLNFKTIITNDWEPYSYITQFLYIQEDEQSIKELFNSFGGLTLAINYFNKIATETVTEPYVSKYYAPQNINDFDITKERLFYTPQNAKHIDNIRNRIEELYPEGQLNRISLREKRVLLALLLYKSSVHTNTSGVFKAFYKDFGGYGKNALKRITTPLFLDVPVLLNYSSEVIITSYDAIQFFDLQKISSSQPSMVYLDPPYNTHQYGSNYHMLNTLVKWDKQNLDYTYTDQGLLKAKSAIRKDWVDRKSTFCSTYTATNSFQVLIDKIKADFILVSYSIDGIIEFKTMLNILSKKGKLSIVLNSYNKFRGGRKSYNHKTYNIEFVLIVNTREKSSPKDIPLIQEAIVQEKNLLSIRGLYKRDLLRKKFEYKTNNVWVWKKNCSVSLEVSSYGLFKNISNMEILGNNKQNHLIMDLQYCTCKNRIEELQELESWLECNKNILKADILIFLKYLKYIAYKKYSKQFLYYYKFVQIISKKHKITREVNKQIQALYDIFSKRVKVI